jgi:acetylglutamate synthase
LECSHGWNTSGQNYTKQFGQFQKKILFFPQRLWITSASDDRLWLNKKLDKLLGDSKKKQMVMELFKKKMVAMPIN